MTLRSQALASTAETELARPICDQIDDEIIAVPKSAMARFSKNAPTARKNVPTGVFQKPEV